jgi:hypothetical protein
MTPQEQPRQELVVEYICAPYTPWGCQPVCTRWPHHDGPSIMAVYQSRPWPRLIIKYRWKKPASNGGGMAPGYGHAVVTEILNILY